MGFYENYQELLAAREKAAEKAANEARERFFLSHKPRKRKFAIECIRQGRSDLLDQWIKDAQHINQINVRTNRIGTLLEFAIKSYISGERQLHGDVHFEQKYFNVKLIAAHSNSTTIKDALKYLDNPRTVAEIRLHLALQSATVPGLGS